MAKQPRFSADLNSSTVSERQWDDRRHSLDELGLADDILSNLSFASTPASPLHKTQFGRGPRKEKSLNQLSKSFAFGAKTPPFFSPISKIRTSYKVSDLSSSFSEQSTSSPLSTKSFFSSRGKNIAEGRGLGAFSFNTRANLSTSLCSTPYSTTPYDSSNSLNNGSSGSLTQASPSSLLKSFIAEPQSHMITHKAHERNPNKALLNMDANLTILLASKMACQLFECDSSSLIGHKLTSLVRRDEGLNPRALVQELLLDDAGGMHQANGKIVVALTKRSGRVPISLWIRPLDIGTGEVRYLAIMERVMRTSSVIVYEDIMPSPSETSSSPQGHAIKVATSSNANLSKSLPSTPLKKLREEPESSSSWKSSSSASSQEKQGGILWCDSALLGLLHYTMDELAHRPITSILPACNNLSENKEGQHVTVLTKDGGSLPVNAFFSPISDDRFLKSEEYRVVPSTLLDPAHWEYLHVCVLHFYAVMSGLVSVLPDGKVYGCNETFVSLLFGYSQAQLVSQSVMTIIPNFCEGGGLLEKHEGRPKEGSFVAFGRHRDGSRIEITYDVKKMAISENELIYCVWITCNSSNYAMRRIDSDPLNSSLLAPDSPHTSFVSVPRTPSPAPSPRPAILSRSSSINKEDLFARHYETLDTIGQGTFGSVLVARRHEDGLIAIVKLIPKAKVLRECWEQADPALGLPELPDDEFPGQVPRELVLLHRISHPNIVKMLEVFHNATTYQLVMEKHGNGKDLFSLIEEKGHLDEPLASHIFRQVVEGVAYLHRQKICHRDIKDENIILDEICHAQIIDFGAAAYLRDGELFDTFCGTLEYCAPEVLEGNMYPGPELEVFAMGVTLYTMIFGENPFFDVEETIAGILNPPFSASPSLSGLLMWMLESDPHRRATIADIKSHPWLAMDVSKRIAELELEEREWQGITVEDEVESDPEDTEELKALFHREINAASSPLPPNHRQKSF